MRSAAGALSRGLPTPPPGRLKVSKPGHGLRDLRSALRLDRETMPQRLARTLEARGHRGQELVLRHSLLHSPVSGGFGNLSRITGPGLAHPRNTGSEVIGKRLAVADVAED